MIKKAEGTKNVLVFILYWTTIYILFIPTKIMSSVNKIIKKSSVPIKTKDDEISILQKFF